MRPPHARSSPASRTGPTHLTTTPPGLPDAAAARSFLAGAPNRATHLTTLRPALGSVPPVTTSETAADLDALRRRATGLGVETSYWDVEGMLHHASEATLRAVVDVLEADAHDGAARRVQPVVVSRGGRVAIGDGRGTHLVLADGATLDVPAGAGYVELPPDVPIGCHRLHVDVAGGDETVTVVVPPPNMPRAAALDGGCGLFVPAYALWESDRPQPSFGHLAELAARLHRAGVDVLSTLPLYAALLDEPFDPSPYAPASRLHWNELYLDDGGLPAGPPVPETTFIDWRSLARRRRDQLLAAAGELDSALHAELDRFTSARPDIVDYASYRAPREAGDGRPAALVRRSHELAQYLANRQLAAIEGPGRATLALDLPIGSHPDGYETWAFPELFADGMSVGAPPDEFFTEGQDWGFPPPLPGTGRRNGHGLWQRLVARAGEHASMLRIDHVMGVHRLWWIPAGAGAADGVYVRYPREELLAVIAAEAHRAATTIVGEDLGTVPDAVREAMRRWDMVGMYEEQFLADGRPRGAVPARSVAGIRTHDMPAFAAFVGAARAAEPYRARLEHELGRPVGATPGGLLDAALERLAASDAYLVLADLDDLTGETVPHNVPGRVLPTTWRRRLPAPTSEVLGDLDIRRRLHMLAARRGCGTRPGEEPR